MSKQLKTLITDSLRSRFDGIETACVADISGLNTEETIAVRRALGSKHMRAMVVKNSLARRAFQGGPLERLGEGLNGPCALITGGDNAIDVAKEIVRLAGEFPRITLKEGLLEGETDLISVADLAKMKGLGELLGEVAMLVSSPGRSLAGCLSSPQGKIAGCLKAIADKGNGGE